METTQINLSEFVGKDVTGVFDNGDCFKGRVEWFANHIIVGSYLRQGEKVSFYRYFYNDGHVMGGPSYWKETFKKVVKIKAMNSDENSSIKEDERQPEINFWQLLEKGGRRVRVTYRNGETETGFANLHDHTSAYAFMVCGKRYAFDGRFWNTESPLDIVKVNMGNRRETLKEIERLENELKVQKENLELCGSASVGDIEVGEELDDGSILLKKSGGMALLIAPDSTEVYSTWIHRSKVFEKMIDAGLNGEEWFFPSVQLLKLATSIIPERMEGKTYWSCEEIDSVSAKLSEGIGAKCIRYHVRLFRCLLY